MAVAHLHYLLGVSFYCCWLSVRMEGGKATGREVPGENSCGSASPVVLLLNGFSSHK